MSIIEPTQDERRLADSYQRVLSDLIRCAQAVQEGHWPQLAAAASDLSRNAVHLSVAAGELREPVTAPRAEVILDAVARQSATPITRLLHPVRPGSVAKTALTDPFTHPGA
jgi:hypothetical protein